jgi:hypothetical protein
MHVRVLLADGARFENPTSPETIGPNLISSFRYQIFTEELEVGEKPIKPDGTR